MVIRYFNSTRQNRDWHDQGKIVEVRTYWEALRQDGQLPHRHRIDPRGIAGALDNAFLVERIGTGLAQFRIAGMVFHDLMGMDVRGMPLSAVFTGEARLQLQMALERMFHGPASLTLALRSPAGFGRVELQAKMILLPILGHDGNRTMALGCLEMAGAVGKWPRRFNIEASEVARILVPEQAEALHIRPAAVEVTSVPAATSRPHLRLVHSAP